ncbi:hypothetical protein RRG08_013995 [Elysia crispata]|uniref:Uncharacterized protein n=1 Tax=Elysia crispata TaxID=231223 RepID=A0AAE0Z384_9GAST|nr:hypothetical protein RRG08_013995 [Elysia crispata]
MARKAWYYSILSPRGKSRVNKKGISGEPHKSRQRYEIRIKLLPRSAQLNCSRDQGAMTGLEPFVRLSAFRPCVAELDSAVFMSRYLN